MIGHSQGGVQAIKVLYELAGTFESPIPVWNPYTDASDDRTTIVDPLTGVLWPVVGLSVSYVSVVGAGGAAMLLPNQWSMAGKLRTIPDTVDEFTGFALGLDLWAWTLAGAAESTEFRHNGTATVRKRVGYRGLIVSFEPTPFAARILKEKSRHDAHWLISDHAISTQDGEQTFNIMSDSEFSSLSVPDHSQTALFKDKNTVSETVVATTETLASALARLRGEHGFQRPFLKLDTQGWDARIVEASAEAMPAFIGLQSELAVKRLYAHSTDFRDALSLYERCGFTLSSFVPNNAGHFPVLVETDCIMVNSRFPPVP